MIINILTVLNCVKAIEINTANIISGGDCGSLLTYKGIVVKAYYAEYIKNGSSYPAYCLDKTKHGVDNNLSYSVSVQNAITDVGLWRIIINGYPYKTIQELGCSNKEEAFTATKQAIYCYIHGNNPNDYTAIGDAGQRTLNALNKILNDSKNCIETQISNTINIIKENEEFEVDKIDKNYVSKTYSIKAGTTISEYKVELTSKSNQLPEEIKITDLNNKSKVKFSQNEKFKILIPIKNLTKDGNFEINIETQIKNKPVLYGKAENTSYQDYALTGATYEDTAGNTEDKYGKNETKIEIIKQDKETHKRLNGVEFNILNENKEVIYAGLKTDNNGEIKIENLLPGKYFITETNAQDGYLIDDKIIEFKVELNQSLTITIDNQFEKKTENPKEEKTVTETVVRKLPVTGM